MSKSKHAKAKGKKDKKAGRKGEKAKKKLAKAARAAKKQRAKAGKRKSARAAKSAVPQSVTPYLSIRGADRAIAFYCEVFDASEVMRLADPTGKIGHAEIEIGGLHVMLADEFPEMDVRGPEAYGGSPVSVHLYVPDVDDTYSRALAAGAKGTRPPSDQFYGDRAATLVDPFGHRWFLATRVEEVPVEEMEKRYAAMTAPA